MQLDGLNLVAEVAERRNVSKTEPKYSTLDLAGRYLPRLIKVQHLVLGTPFWGIVPGIS